MIEKTILSNLIFNDEYTRKVLPFLDERYFSDIVDNLSLMQALSFLIDSNSFLGTKTYGVFSVVILIYFNEKISPRQTFISDEGI